MVTRANTRQIKGVTVDTLQQELLAFHQNIGYFIGNVLFFDDLKKLEPKLGNVAFVESLLMWVYWNGEEWIKTGGASNISSPRTTGQVTKLNVEGVSESYPKTIDIPVPYTEEFKHSAVEVLKFKKTEEGRVSTLIDFLNTDIHDFEEIDYVEFTGSMSPKTTYKRTLEEKNNEVSSGFLFSIPLSINEFLKINSITIK